MKNRHLLSMGIIFSLLITSYAQQKDTIWYEDFEREWYDNWYVDVGTWEVGTPTSGPLEAYAGNNCAGTVLNGDYPANTNTRLIRYNSFVVPKEDMNPRLRFRYWFRFSTSDFATVQIKTESGNWEDISVKYTRYGSDLWGHESLDLTAYADSLVQIAFYFHSEDKFTTSGPDVSDGLFLDNVMLVTGPYNFDLPVEFEDGLGDWAVENGTWEVGIPVTGPDTILWGKSCAGTYLSGEYYSNIDSRLISPPFVLPSAAENPRIHFSHWWNYSTSDWGVVQVRTKNSSWKTVSPTYNRSSDNNWYRSSIDLVDFADSVVQIAFYFHSEDKFTTSGPDVSDGWFIDHFSLITGPYLFQNTEDYELGQGDWDIERGIWEFGAPESGPSSAQGGYSCAGTNLGAEYYKSSDSRLISPPFTVPIKTANPVLRFWHWFSFSTADWGNVQITTDKGITWETITSEDFKTSSTSWSPYIIPLSAYAGKQVQVAFYFHSEDNFTTSGPDVSDGWFIDNVKIHDNSELTVYAGPDVTLDACGSTTMQASVQGGTEPYSIKWIPETGLDDPASLTPVVSPSDTTIYILHVTDVNGCFRTDRIIINANCTAPNTETDIFSFSLGKPPQKGDANIDQVAHKIDLQVQYGTDLTNLTPSFTLSEGAIATVDGVEQLSGQTPNDFTNPVVYRIIAEDGTTAQEWTVTVTVSEADKPEFMTFGFGSPPQLGDALIDADLHTAQLKVENGTDLTNLVAIFTVPDNASATIEGVEQISGITANDFTNPVLYTITAEDNITSQEWTVTVIEAALNETDFLSFTFGDPPQMGEAIIDPVNHTVDVLVENGTDVTNLVARYTLSEGASAKVNGIDQTSEVTSNNYTNPLFYIVIASDEKTLQEWTVSVEEDNATGVFSESGPVLKIYPNPFSDQAVIEVANFQQSELHLSIHGSLGNKVLEKLIYNNSSITFGKEMLPEGTYLFVLRSDDLLIKKIVMVQ